MKKLLGASKAVFYISFPISFMGFILPIYASNMGSSPIEIGLLYSIFSLCSILIRPIVGNWMDKRGRKSGFIVGILCYTLVSLLFLVGKSYNFLFAARIVQSIAASFLWISVDTMVSDVSSPSERGKNFGIISQSSNRGMFIGSSIGFTLLFNRTVREPFTYIFGIFLLASLVALYLSMRGVEETLEKKQSEELSNNDESKDFKGYILIMGVLSAVESMLAPVMLIYMKETITKDMALISFIFIPGAVLSMFLPSMLGKMSDRLGRKKMLVFGLYLDVVLTILIPFFKDYNAFMVIYTLIILTGLITSPARRSIISEMTGENQRGRAYGIYHLSIGIGGIIGPMVGGYLYQYVGKSTGFYIQALMTFIICTLIVIVLKESNTHQRVLENDTI